MLSGFILPGGDATKQLELALVAEDAGWDGVFVWEGGYGVDAWTLLAAIAARTGRVRLGTMLTPLPWRRPWKVASQVATLDQLSGGRAILTVEAGRHHRRPPAHRRGEDLRVRAAMLDDGIDLIRALWEGRAEFGGERFRYRFEATDQLEVARPVQDRLPIWVVGLWPRMIDAAGAAVRGIAPQFEGEHRGSPERVREMRAWPAENDARPDLDVLAEGRTSADDAEEASRVVTAWAEAGCTWWLESNWEMPHHSDERMREVCLRLEAGPPTVAD